MPSVINTIAWLYEEFAEQHSIQHDNDYRRIANEVGTLWSIRHYPWEIVDFDREAYIKKRNWYRMGIKKKREKIKRSDAQYKPKTDLNILY